MRTICKRQKNNYFEMFNKVGYMSNYNKTNKEQNK